jgi:hypothetical protein
MDSAAIQAEKALLNVPGNPNPVIVNVGGDTIGSAVAIAGVPYSDSGNTCSYAHNYDEVCPWNAPGAPDVVYSISPGADVSVNIDLCTSLFDTKVYVYDGGVGNLVACNDDAGCGTNGYRSYLECVALLAGHTYYIVVDGYSTVDCGTYYLDITECVPCVVDCPPGGIAEGEPDCYDNYVDTFNGGCNSTPNVFSDLGDCSPTGGDYVICATYGGYLYNGLSYRDTDWYTIHLDVATQITWCVAGETDTLVGIIQPPCPVTTFYAYNLGGACTPICVSENLPAGDWFLWAGPLNFGADAGPCGGNYVATLSGLPPCDISVEESSWSTVKSLYR